MSTFRRFEVVEALAGAGKTYQLSHRYLRLIAQGADPSTILAATFTVKASGEIRDRIIHSVASAIHDEQARELLFEGVPELEKTKMACVNLLRKVVANLHKLQIGTIDSFFVKTAKLFGDELGFPTSWSILDEQSEDAVLKLAIANMLKEEDPDFFEELFRLSTGLSTVPVGSTVQSICRYAYDLTRESSLDAWVDDSNKPFPELSKKGFESALAMLEQHGEESKKYKDKYLQSVKRARAGDWKSFVTKGIPKCILDETFMFNKVQISDEVIEHFQPLFNHASAKIVNFVLYKNKGIAQLMALFHNAWTSVKHAKGMYKFEDIAFYLSYLKVFNDVSEVAFRIDSSIDHLLIDEFQDTSLTQWNVLEPIIEEIRQSDSDRSLFFVGDPKQSLYGWRGGNPKLLQHLPERLRIEGPTRLPSSWRCVPAVLELINEVFDNLNQSELLAKHSNEGVVQWLKSYSLHHSARPTARGFATVHTTATNESFTRPNDPCMDCMIGKVVEIVRDIHEKNKSATIGVLVRNNTNQKIQRIVQKLRTHTSQPVFASEYGGNPLTDSAPVTVILSALLLADHPGDTAALFHVSTSPIGESLGLSPTSNRKDACQLSEELRRRLVNQSYADVIKELSAPLFANASDRDQYRLWQLVELAQSFEHDECLRPSEFVAFVKKKRIVDPSSSKVQVMTVHASKGLGFDAVVVCDMHESLWKPPKVLTKSIQDTKQENEVFSPPSKLSVPEDMKFNSIILHQAIMWKEKKAEQVQEALSLLYVAMTRAKYALHLVIPPRPYAESQAKTFDRLIRETLNLDACLPVDTIVWPKPDTRRNNNDELWLSQVEFDEVVHNTKSAIFAKLQKPKHTKRMVANSSPSSLEGGGKVYVKERFAGGTNSAFDWGTLVHKWFEDIEWFEAVPTVAQLVKSALSEEASRIGEEKVQEAAKSCIKAIQSEQFRLALMKPSSYAVVYREQEFAFRVAKGTKFADVVLDETTDIRGSIDRFVVEYDEAGNALQAVITDWKTDTFDDHQLETKIAYYAPQLSSYRLAASRLLGIDIQSVRTLLAFVSRGQVIDITNKT